MAVAAAKKPFLIFKISVLICAFFSFLAWILLLGGISALEDICGSGCGSSLGLSWFIIWFQFFIIIPAITVELYDIYGAWRPVLNILLAVNTTLAIVECQEFFRASDSRVVGGYLISNGFIDDSRLNATLAGYILLCMFNLLIIILSGSRTALHSRYGEDRDVGVATYPKSTPNTSHAIPASSTPVPSATTETLIGVEVKSVLQPTVVNSETTGTAEV